MSNFSTIDLFRLPFLAVINCVKVMDPVEMTIFSACSKKAARLTAMSNPRINQHYQLCIKFSSVGCRLYFNTNDTNILHNLDLSKIFPAGLKGLNVILEVQKLVDFICHLYKCPVTRLTLELEDMEETIKKSVLDWSKFQKGSIQIVELGSPNENTVIPDKNVLEFFENFKIFQTIALLAKTSDKFFDKTEEIHSMFFLPGPGLNQHNIWNLKCFSLKVFDSDMTNQDVNQILKTWRAGEIRNIKLRRIMIEVKNFNVNQALNGIPHFMGRDQIYRQGLGRILSWRGFRNETRTNELYIYEVENKPQWFVVEIGDVEIRVL